MKQAARPQPENHTGKGDLDERDETDDAAVQGQRLHGLGFEDAAEQLTRALVADDIRRELHRAGEEPLLQEPARFHCCEPLRPRSEQPGRHLVESNRGRAAIAGDRLLLRDQRAAQRIELRSDGRELDGGLLEALPLRLGIELDEELARADHEPDGEPRGTILPATGASIACAARSTSRRASSLVSTASTRASKNHVEKATSSASAKAIPSKESRRGSPESERRVWKNVADKAQNAQLQGRK